MFAQFTTVLADAWRVANTTVAPLLHLANGQQSIARSPAPFSTNVDSPPLHAQGSTPALVAADLAHQLQQALAAYSFNGTLAVRLPREQLVELGTIIAHVVLVALVQLAIGCLLVYAAFQFLLHFGQLCKLMFGKLATLMSTVLSTASMIFWAAFAMAILVFVISFLR
jgi:hypothetical protein